jgi:hypothetical protein
VSKTPIYKTDKLKTPSPKQKIKPHAHPHTGQSLKQALKKKAQQFLALQEAK